MSDLAVIVHNTWLKRLKRVAAKVTKYVQFSDKKCRRASECIVAKGSVKCHPTHLNKTSLSRCILQSYNRRNVMLTVTEKYRDAFSVYKFCVAPARCACAWLLSFLRTCISFFCETLKQEIRSNCR